MSRLDLVEELQKHEEGHLREVSKIKEYLSERLSDEPGEVLNQLEAIEVWGARLGYLLADAESFLDRAKFTFLELPDVQGGKTSVDRKIALDSKIVAFRRYRDFMQVLVDSAKNRTMVALGILRYMRAVPDGNPGNQNYYTSTKPKKELGKIY